MDLRTVLNLIDIDRKTFVCYFANQFIVCIGICSVLYKSLTAIHDETKAEGVYCHSLNMRLFSFYQLTMPRIY